MITKLMVKEFVEEKSSKTIEVFNQIVECGSDGAKYMAVGGTEKWLKRYAARHLIISPVKKNQLNFVHMLALDEIEAILNTESDIEKKTAFYTLFINPFRGIWIDLISRYMGLDPVAINHMDREDKESYSAVTDGIFWAGFYLLLES